MGETNEQKQDSKHHMSRRAFVAVVAAAGVAAAGGIFAATYNMRDTSINGPDAFDLPEVASGGEELPVSCTVVYASKHAGNTVKLIRAIRELYPSVKAIDAVATPADSIDVSGDDLVVLASGVYFGQFADEVLQAAKRLSPGQKVFLLYTAGSPTDKFLEKVQQAVGEAGAQVVGSYGCVGAYRMVSLMPVLHEGHPDASEVSGAADAFAQVVES